MAYYAKPLKKPAGVTTSTAQAHKQGQQVRQTPLIQPEHASEAKTAPVQFRAEGQFTPSDAKIRSAGARGVSTPATPLPYLDRIQASFGRYSIRHVRAHVGPEAAKASRAMNALAYTTGHNVVFSGIPDLRTAAHEAAHVVQQQAGVQLEGGIGREGDVYERHADAVADTVLAGRSTENLLETLTVSVAGRRTANKLADSGRSCIQRLGSGSTHLVIGEVLGELGPPDERLGKIAKGNSLALEGGNNAIWKTKIDGALFWIKPGFGDGHSNWDGMKRMHNYGATVPSSVLVVEENGDVAMDQKWYKYIIMANVSPLRYIEKGGSFGDLFERKKGVEVEVDVEVDVEGIAEQMGFVHVVDIIINNRDRLPFLGPAPSMGLHNVFLKDNTVVALDSDLNDKWVPITTSSGMTIDSADSLLKLISVDVRQYSAYVAGKAFKNEKEIVDGFVNGFEKGVRAGLKRYDAKKT